MLHNHQFHYLNQPLDREIRELYISMAIKGLALAMIGIFEPVYLYLQFDHSVSKMLIYFGIIHGLYALLVPLSGKIMQKVGLEWAMFLSSPFIFGYYLFLYFMGNFGALWWIVMLSILFNLIYKIFFWPAFHTHFAKFSRRKDRAKSIGLLNVIASLAGVGGPLIGGLILTFFDFPFLFGLTLTLLFLSSIVLLFSKVTKISFRYNYIQLFKIFFKKKIRKTLIALGAEGAEKGIALFLWPIFLFFVVKEYAEMGFVTSAVFLALLIFTLYIGKRSDTMEKEKLIKIGSFLNATAWIGKIFPQTALQAFFADVYHRSTQTFLKIPFGALTYDKAALVETEIDEFIVIREMAHNFLRSLALVGLGVLLLSTTKLFIGFLFAALFSLLFVLLKK
jgi:MFS family permease